MRKAMEMGRHGIVWTIGQSSMLIPFAAGALLWNERISGFRIAGLLLLALSLPFCAAAKKDAGEIRVSSWLGYCFAAFALIGASQFLSMIPSHWEGWEDKAGLRVPLLFLFSALLWLGMIVLQRRRIEFAPILRLSLAYSAFVLAGQLTLYRSLDIMSAQGLSSIVYPMAIGTCIGGFFVYSIIALKEKFGFGSGLGVASAIAGITIIALN
ncbi:MAG: hypothetical protein A2X49_05035 [Lentisphaerae bacterium GWF2_52_8]|nr:MAG: hypothetical protein A2X49_05035 [Lentisphaerae bacterium GWF2_52_8]